MDTTEFASIKAELARDAEEQTEKRKKTNRRRIFILGILCLAAIPFLIHYAPYNVEPSGAAKMAGSFFIGCFMLFYGGCFLIVLSTKFGESFPFDI